MIPARGSRRGGLRDVVAHSTTTTTKASAWEPPRRSTFVCVSLCVSLFSCFSLLSSPPRVHTHTHTHTPHRRRPRPSSPVRRRFSRLWGPHPHRPSLDLNLLVALIIVVIRPQPPSLGTPGRALGPGGALKTRNLLSIWERKKNENEIRTRIRGLGDPPQQAISTLSWRNVRECVQNRVAGGRGVQAKTGARQKNAATPTTEESRLQVRR